VTSIFQRAEGAIIHAWLELYLQKRLGKQAMASPIVQELIGFVTSLLSTGSATMTLPGVTEDVAGYAVTETVTVSAKKA
jgi:hypothetical protein